jgi:hypothetical protein
VDIDRKAFLALAMGMNSGACIVVQQRDTVAPPVANTVQVAPSQTVQVTQVSQPGYVAPTSEAYAPTQECIGWGPNGACNRWEPVAEGQVGYVAPTSEAYAPTQECVGWAPNGQCNRWAPTSEK